MIELISSHVDVSPNEYVTKYSLNRNFQKLTENDAQLAHESQKSIDYNTVNTYIDGRTYYKGECIFYKTTSRSMSIYALSCVADATVNAPSCITDSVGNLIVVSNDKWKIIGINDGLSANPVDYANEYIKSAKSKIFAHQSDDSLSVHPTGRLGIDDSTIAFKTLDNLDDNRKIFFYPNHVQSLHPDTTILDGHMRKWDCGLLEYDIIFKVGCFGEMTDDGVEILSANCLNPSRGDRNQFYFKDAEDYAIFNRKSDKHVVTGGTKQVNLNSELNAYHGEIKFPQEFKDLDYMVFASDVKSIESEAVDLRDEGSSYPPYDDRLAIQHLTVKDHREDADYSRQIEIPNWIETIDEYALASIAPTNVALPSISFAADSKLVDVRANAFKGTAFKHIEFPKSTRLIGMNALAKCENLESVDIWVNVDREQQIILDYNVFADDTKLSTISLHYFDDADARNMFAATQSDSERRISAYSGIIDLSAKLTDPNMQTLYGISRPVNIVVDDSQIRKNFSQSIAMRNLTFGQHNNSGDEYVAVDVQKLLARLKSENDDTNSLQRSSASRHLLCSEMQQTALTCLDVNGNTQTLPLQLDSFGSFSIQNLSSQVVEVCVDISSAHFNASSISGLSCDTLNIINLARADRVCSFADGREVCLWGFAPSAFVDCSIRTVEFTGDVSEQDVDYAMQAKKSYNILNLPDGCVAKAQNAKWLVVNDKLVDFPHHASLSIDDDCALVSCAAAVCADVCIPYGVKCIKPYAFAGTSISALSIPSTMVSIENNAFNQMQFLTRIQFDPQTKLHHIGDDIFDSTCSNIVDFKLY